jgi:hypothetical protein
MKQPSASASRMRRSRVRRRRGEAVISPEVGPATVNGLIALGWLAAPDHRDKGAISLAVADLVEWAILARMTPFTGAQGRTSFACDLPRTTVKC